MDDWTKKTTKNVRHWWLRNGEGCNYRKVQEVTSNIKSHLRLKSFCLKGPDDFRFPNGWIRFGWFCSDLKMVCGRQRYVAVQTDNHHVTMSHAYHCICICIVFEAFLCSVNGTPLPRQEIKIPSEMEVAPRYNYWQCWHCWHCWHYSTLFDTVDMMYNE